MLFYVFVCSLCCSMIVYYAFDDDDNDDGDGCMERWMDGLM